MTVCLANLPSSSARAGPLLAYIARIGKGSTARFLGSNASSIIITEFGPKVNESPPKQIFGDKEDNRFHYRIYIYVESKSDDVIKRSGKTYSVNHDHELSIG